MRTQEYYDEVFGRIFPGDSDIENKIKKRMPRLLGAIFDNEEASYEKAMAFLDKFKEEIIGCSLKNEQLINELLLKGDVIDRTEKDTITKEYFEELITRIKNKDFDEKSIVFYLNVLNMYNIFSYDFNEDTIREVLNSDIYNIANNSIFMANSEIFLSLEQKVASTNKLLWWKRRCGEGILPEIFHLERLRENIITLINSSQVAEKDAYAPILENLLQLCNYAIYVRDSKMVPSEEDIHKIDTLFDQYEEINKMILLEELDTGNVFLVHFVRDNNVDYQLYGKTFINFSDSGDNPFDKEQADFFFDNYIQLITKRYEERTGKKADLEDPEYREVIENGLKIFNNTLNYRPLDRLPIKIQEVSSAERLHYVIRNESSRLSCSLVSKEGVRTHLDRRIGIIVRPKKASDIMSISHGYTSQNEYHNFNADARPSTRIILDTSKQDAFNEICVDASNCEVVGILLLTDDEQMTARAEALAESYHVEVIKIIPPKEGNRRHK